MIRAGADNREEGHQPAPQIAGVLVVGPDPAQRPLDVTEMGRIEHGSRLRQGTSVLAGGWNWGGSGVHTGVARRGSCCLAAGGGLAVSPRRRGCLPGGSRRGPGPRHVAAGARARGPRHGLIRARGPRHGLIRARGPRHGLIRARGPRHGLIRARGPLHGLGQARGPRRWLGRARGPRRWLRRVAHVCSPRWASGGCAASRRRQSSGSVTSSTSSTVITPIIRLRSSTTGMVIRL